MKMHNSRKIFILAEECVCCDYGEVSLSKTSKTTNIKSFFKRLANFNEKYSVVKVRILII